MNSKQEDKGSSGSRSPTRKLNLLGQVKPLNAMQKAVAEDQYNNLKIKNVMKKVDNQQPTDQINHFISVTEIDKMIKTAMQSTVDLIPRLQLDIKTHYSQIRELKMANSNNKKEFESIYEQFKELKVIDKKLSTIGEELKKSESFNNEKFINNGNQINRNAMDLREIKGKVENMTTSIERKEEMMLEKHKLLDTKHQQFTERFDEIFEGINKDRKGVGYKVKTLESSIDRAQRDLSKITADVQKVVKDQIDSIFNKHLDHEKQFMSINRMMRDYENTKKKLARLDYIVQDVQDRTNDDVIVNNYMLKGLPALIHLQICEGLERVVGQDYMQQFVEYSRIKTKELLQYIKHADNSCIRSTTERTNALMKWYVEKDLGTLPFVYGLDIRPKMSEEDQKHIKQEKEKCLVERLKKVQVQDRLLKDMFELVTKEEQRNEVVIEHSLKKFPVELVVKLKNKLIEYKVIKQGKYEELDCIHRAPPEPRVDSQQSMPRLNANAGGNLSMPRVDTNFESNGQLSARGKRQPSAAGRNTTTISVGSVQKLQIGKQSTGPASSVPGNSMMGRRGGQQKAVNFPDKIFMVHKQEMRPYKVLDTRWQKKFDRILTDYSLYKSKQLKNVNQFTKMQVDLCKEMEQNKTVLKDFQEQFDLFEEEEFKRWDKLTEEKNQQVDSIKKQFNAVEDWQRECEFEMEKTVKAQKETKLKFESHMDYLTQRNTRLETQLDRLKEDIKKEMKRASEGRQDSHSSGGGHRSKSRGSVIVSCGGSQASDKRRESKRQISLTDTAPKKIKLFEESVVEERTVESEEDKDVTIGSGEDEEEEDSDHNIFGGNLQLEVDVKHLQKATTGLARKKQIKVKTQPAEEVKQETNEEAVKKQLKKKNMSIKQQQRAKTLEKLEIQKQKAELAEIKKAEREEKAAEERKIQKQKEIELKRIQKQEEEDELMRLRKEEEKQQRLERRTQFQKTQDGLQKGTNLLMKINKMINKEHKKSGTGGKQMNSRQSSKQSFVRAPTSKMSQIQSIGVFQNAFGAAQISQQSQNITQGDESPIAMDAWESSDSDSDSSHSIGIFGGRRKKKSGPPGMTEDQVKEILDEELSKLRRDFQSVVEGRIRSLLNKLEDSTVELSKKLEENSKGHSTKLGSLEGEFVHVKTMNNKFIAQTEFKMKSFTEQLENESRELHKLKIGMKNTIKEELHRMDSLYNMSDYEFKRVNSCLKFTMKILQLILEDSMISQLLQEQEIEDRKQIGLFGMKKNSEILGVNQGALTNAYDRQGSNKRLSSTDKWALPNKDLTLSEILHPNENRDSRMKLANQTIDQLQTISETSRTPMRITDKKIDFTQNLSQAQNTIKIDKNCASCSGNVSQVLTQVKLACLSYTNTPIQFGSSKLLNSDLIAVKEMILKKCEIFSNTMDELNQYGSVFGILGPNNDKNIDHWVKMVNSDLFKCGKSKHSKIVDIPVSPLQSETLTPSPSMPMTLNIQSRSKLPQSPSKHKMEVKISSSKIEIIKQESPTYIDDGTQEHSKDSGAQLHDESETKRIEDKPNVTSAPFNIDGSNRIIHDGLKQQSAFDNVTVPVDRQFKETQPHVAKFKIDTLNRLIVQKKAKTGESKRYDQASKILRQMNAAKPVDHRVDPPPKPAMCPLFLGEKDDVQNDLAHILDDDLDDDFQQLSLSLLSKQEKLDVKTDKINRDAGLYNRTKKLLVDKSHEKTIDSHRKKTTSVRNFTKKSVSRLKTPKSQISNFQTMQPQTQKYSTAHRNQLNLHVSSQGDFMVLGGQQEPPKTQADASALFMQRRISNRKNAQEINQMLQNETFESVTQTSHRPLASNSKATYDTSRITKKINNQSRGVTPGCNGLGTKYMVSSPPVKHRAKTPSSINIMNRPTHHQAAKLRGEQQTPVGINNFQTHGSRNDEQNLWSFTSNNMLSQTFTQSNQDQASGTFVMKRNTVYSGLNHPQYGLQHVSSNQQQNFQVPDKIYVTLLDEEINSNQYLQDPSPVSGNEKTNQVQTFSYPHNINSVTIDLPDQNDDIISQSNEAEAYRRQISGATTEYINPQVSNEKRRQNAEVLELVDEVSLPVNK